MFANKEFFFKGYPVNKKSDCDEALSKFIHDFGAPDEMTMDGSKEETGGNRVSEIMRNHDIPSRVCEPERPNNNPAERCIRKVCKR